MNHEKIIKRADGSSVKICVHVYFDTLKGCQYSFSIFFRYSGKIKWRQRPSLPYWEKERMSANEIENYEFSFLSKEEVYQCYLECWEKMKPKKF